MTNTGHDTPTDTPTDAPADAPIDAAIDTAAGRAPEVADPARRARAALRHPAMWGPVLVLAGFALFGLGQGIGESFHDAFGGDTGAAVVFGAGLLAVVSAVVGLGVLGDRWLAGRRADDAGRPED